MNENDISDLTIYAFNEKNISIEEYSMLSLEYIINILEKLIKMM